MIEAEVKRGGHLIMQRTYYDPSLSLERALKNLEDYIIAEQLNHAGECVVRVRFPNLANS
jgi:hypothetical protein